MAQELIEFIAKSLVDKPEEVSSQITESEGSKVIELKVSPDDIGKVIGKHGRIVRSLRTILSASSVRGGERYLLEIVDGE